MRVLGPDQNLPDGPGRMAAMPDAWAEAWRSLRAALAEPELRRVYVLVGLPGSGKTHWAGAQPPLPQAVAFDSVMSQRSRRMAIARRIRQAGKQAIAVVVSAPLALCCERQQERPTWRRVPEMAIRRAAVRMRSEPVVEAEGWDSVWIVGCRRDGRTTRAWAERRGEQYFRWRTRDDNRVRSEHERLHGRIFSWEDGAAGLYPGEAPNCRCWAESVDDEDVVLAGGSPRARPLTMPKWARRRPRRNR